MNFVDFVFGLPLLYALYKGFKDGVVVQLGGLVGLIIGVYLAFRYASAFGVWMGMDGTTAQVVGFIVIVVGVLLAITVLGRLMRGLFKVAGLGMLDQIGGMLIAVIKMALIISVILSALEAVNSDNSLYNPKKVNESIFYKPIKKVAGVAFPYLIFIKDQVYNSQD